MQEYDVIVVGAGPGGSTAAHFLARAGLRVGVVEKKSFPRAKTCGDGLTPRSVKVLDEVGLGPQMKDYRKVVGLRVLGASRTLEMQWPRLSGYPDYGLVRPRKSLDADIAARAAAAGAQFHFGCEATEPLVEDGRAAGVRWVRKQPAAGGGVTKVDEGAFTAPFTVVADGASSPFGKKMGITRSPGYPMGLAIRTYYSSDRSNDDFFESWLELRKGDELLPGYGWIFPVGDGTVNIGVGLLNTFGSWRDVNLSHLQRSYIDMLPKSYGITHEHQTEPYQSGRLPMGGSVERPHGPGYIVIGDAAGFVNPFNGEGIAYALETGKLAATLVADALRSGASDDILEYRQALHDIYGAYYRLGRRFVKVIGRPAAFRALCQVGMRSQTVMQFVFQVLANLAEPRSGKLGDRGFRALMKIAEHDLPELPAPQIPGPVRSGPKESEVGAA